LEFPALQPVWEQWAIRPAEVESACKLHGYEDSRQFYAKLARLVHFLIDNEQPIGLSHLGARFFGDSKALRDTPLLRKAVDWLLLLEGDDESGLSARELLTRYAVIENPTSVKVTLSGPLHYRKCGETFSWISRLWHNGECATLTLDNLEGIEECWCDPPIPHVITCENETPFCHLVRSRDPGVVLYTEGYPNYAGKQCLRLLPLASCMLLHWGDSDLDGLRIAAQLGHIHPIRLWRCAQPDLLRHQPYLVPLTPAANRRAALYLERHPEFPFADELRFTLEFGWLEQENWRGQ